MSLSFSSRRQFLKTSSLLALGAFLAPAFASLPDKIAPNIQNDLENNKIPNARADIRSLDFESHNILLNTWQKN